MPTAVEFQDFKNLVIIAGPSAGGKDTTANRLIDTFGYHRLVSTTTRAMRDGEMEGDQYRFVSESAFLDAETKGFFLEKIEFCGNKYGLSIDELYNLEEFNVTIMTPAGIMAVEKYLKDAKKSGIILSKVFIDISLEDQVSRLQARGCNMNEIFTRLQSGITNIKNTALSYDLVLNSSFQSPDEIANLVNSLVFHKKINESSKELLRHIWALKERE